MEDLEKEINNSSLLKNNIFREAELRHTTVVDIMHNFILPLLC